MLGKRRKNTAIAVVWVWGTVSTGARSVKQSDIRYALRERKARDA